MGSGAGCAAATANVVVPTMSTQQRQVDVRGLISATKRPHFRVPKGSSNGGECMLYLESVRHPACNNIQVVARVRKRGDPYGDDSPVSTRAETPDSGGVLRPEVRWPPRNCAGVSSWHSAQPLGIPIAEREGYDLDLELRQGSLKVGNASVLLDEPTLHCPVGIDILPDNTSRRTLKSRSGESKVMVSYSLCFQLVDSHAVLHKKTVVLIRHAESVWNEARNKKHFHKMAQETDHPLSAHGRQQAEALSSRLNEAANGRMDGNEADRHLLNCLLKPDVVWVSPLTRAVQTAVIGLGPLLTRGDGLGELTLVPNAREKQNVGGFDCMSRKTGHNILQHVLGKLREQNGGKDDENVTTFSRLHFNTEQVEEQWWTDGQSESKEEMQVRARDFMNQLLYAPQKAIVVVGHSLFFRHVVSTYLSDDFRSQASELARNLSAEKLENCGVLRLEVDPRKGVDGKPITDARLLLGSTFAK
mmetsp:Transcript_133205/g.385439  ORF Transcript_133205/g.385439 Transcript_133205/m.385439 type:complete len:473 (-) Transcript_133205:77-1495(-)